MEIIDHRADSALPHEVYVETVRAFHLRELYGLRFM